MSPASFAHACPDCDLLVRVEDGIGRCPRCGASLGVDHSGSPAEAAALAGSAVVLLAVASYSNFLGFTAAGKERVITLLDVGSTLANDRAALLAATVILGAVVIPLAIPALALLSATLPRNARRWPARVLAELEHWHLADVFLIGALISLTKIAAMAQVTLGTGFYAYVGAVVCGWMTSERLRAPALLHQAPASAGHAHPGSDPAGTGPNASALGLAHCHTCHATCPAEKERCHHCGTPLHTRIPLGLQRCWAWLITSTILYVPANLLPVMVTTSVGRESPSTIAGGVEVLWEHGSYGLAIIILVASIVIPILKMAAIATLALRAARPRAEGQRRAQTLYRVVEAVGRWSLIDVFVVALLVALVQVGSVMRIDPGPGALSFAGVVMATMLSARALDSRLLWGPFPSADAHARPFKQSS